jgi:hypothetical protein
MGLTILSPSGINVLTVLEIIFEVRNILKYVLASDPFSCDCPSYFNLG